MRSTITTFILSLILTCPILYGQSDTLDIQVIGQMKDAMWKGRISGIIDIDTIGKKEHLYGLGPLENLAGELLILDGHSYMSQVVTDSTMHITETYHLKAPFFAYGHIDTWKEQSLPDSVITMKQLESYLLHISTYGKQPFMYKLIGIIESAKIHVFNLPTGSVVSSPEDARKGQVNYMLTSEHVEILGFFSTEHQTIFTHHDTFMHMHLINNDLSMMGHVDDLKIKPGAVKLLLPAN